MRKTKKQETKAVPLAAFGTTPESYTGTYIVFEAATESGDSEIVVAKILRPLSEEEFSYAYDALLAFDRRDDLRYDPSQLTPIGSDGEACVMLPQMLARFGSFTLAFIFAHGLLAEGNRWKAAA